MHFFVECFQLLFQSLNCPTSRVILQSISLVALSALLAQIIRKNGTAHHAATSLYPLIFFLIPTFAIIAENSTDIVRYLYPESGLKLFLSCVAWTMGCIKFHAFFVFIEQLIYLNKPIRRYHYPIFLFEIIICILICADKIYRYSYAQSLNKYSIMLYQIVVISWFISIIPSIITIIKKLSTPTLPIIINKQLKILLLYFITPQLISLIIEFTPLFTDETPTNITIFENISLILMVFSIYYCFNHILQFRFLNLAQRVQVKPNISFSNTFQETLEHINTASTVQELSRITQQFLAEQLDISKQNIVFHIISHQAQDDLHKNIELFLTNPSDQHTKAIETLLKNKILIGHELEFDAFYSNNPELHLLLKFLRSINCDIFLPITNNKKIIAYVAIATTRANTLYNQNQQNKMLVFAQFLAPAIHLMLQQDVYTMLLENKHTKEILHEKTQEVTQYKESIKQLLKDRIENHIGIIFYKSRHFAFKNLEGQTLLGFNPNLDPAHPTTATLINFAQQVEKYQSAQTMHLTMSNNQKLIVVGMPQAEIQAGILLIIRKPEATDIIKMHIDALKNPAERDYLLYLETTKVGQNINKLLPSSNEAFIQTKVTLLQAILQKNTLLIHSNEPDITPLIELMHTPNNQHNICILDTQQDSQAGIKLFGLNPLINPQSEPALLEKYPDGTIVLDNVEHLDHVTQTKLVQFIKYGIYTPFNSEQRKLSETRIVCTTNYDLESLRVDNKIIPELYQELRKHVVTIPSLITMDSAMLNNIIDEYMRQIIQEQGHKNVVALSAKEKEHVINKRIVSLFQLRQKIVSLMTLKANNKLAEENVVSQPSRYIDTSCPELQIAAQLGKHALKDVQLMKNLWKKLGSQTKIADLLGVNRSSVSRRCKDYHLN